MKEELLEREAQAWNALRAALDAVPTERRTEEGVVPGWSAQDLVWHCGYWADYVGRELEAIAAGGSAEADDEDDDVNQRVHVEARAMTWEEAFAKSAGARERARAALLAVGEPSESIAAEFASETFEHYDEHAEQIASFLDRA